ncbi:MAG: AEC family transporter [Alphaproteobacteria bacterium]
MFVQVLSTIFPVFSLVFVGWALGKRHWISDIGLVDINKIVFYIAIPSLLFRSVVMSDGVNFNASSLFLTYYIGVLSIYGACFIIGQVVFKLNIREAAVMAMASTFSNNLMVAFPILQFGWGEAATVRLFALLSIHATVLWGITLILIEVGAARQSEAKFNLKKSILTILKNLAKNPILIALTLGGIWHLTGYHLPAFLDNLLSFTGRMAAPLTLFALGVSLSRFSLDNNRVEPAFIVFIKCFFLPLFIYILGRFIFKLDDTGVIVTTIMAAASVGANPYILAQNYNIYKRRVATSFLLSVCTVIFTYMFLLYAFFKGIL